MKNSFNYSMIVLLLGSIFLIQSCNLDKCHETKKYIVYNPVYMTKAQLRNIKIKEAQPLKNPGKIYVFNQYLLINELYKGIHIYDNTDKANPVNLSFISIPGNVDMAVKNSVLYADNYLDLLSFDISNPQNPLFLDSISNVFSENKYEHNSKGYKVYFKPTNIIEELDCDDAVDDIWWREDDILINVNSSKSGSNYTGSAGQNISIGGSMARFTILDNRLYIVDFSKLHIFNIDNPKKASYTNDVSIGWGIETIFPLKDKLFIGSNSGMFIFDAANKDKPSLLSSFNHARSCDPVFISGDIAYITLRSGTKCQGYTNQLDVVDIKDLLSPQLIKSYPMKNPHGLTIIDKTMVLCEGDYGAKILNIENPQNIKIKSKIENKHFYDAIGMNKKDIIIVGNDGLYQYKLDGYELKEISSIPIEK